MSEQSIDSKSFRFTQKNIAALPPNPKSARATDFEVSDTQVVGLKVLVGKSGVKKFLLRYSFRQRKCSIAIGAFGAFTVDEARTIANQYKAKIAQGIDPKQERDEHRARMTFADFITHHYLPHAQVNKRSVKSDAAKLRLYLLPRFGNQILEEMTTLSLQQYHNHLLATLAPATANRHLSLLHRIFALAIQWGYLEKNPASLIDKFQENNQQQRFLNAEEIRRLFSAADADENTIAAAYIKFLLLTGVRRSEGLAAKWEHIDLTASPSMWFVPHTKTGKSRYVILNPMALQVLASLPHSPDNPYVFPGKVAGQPLINPIKAFKRIIARAGIEKSFRLHDIRHTVASLIINNGGTLYDVQAALAHANSSMSERYAHLSNERREKTSQQLSLVVAEAIENVTQC